MLQETHRNEYSKEMYFGFPAKLQGNQRKEVNCSQIKGHGFSTWEHKAGGYALSFKPTKMHLSCSAYQSFRVSTRETVVKPITKHIKLIHKQIPWPKRERNQIPTSSLCSVWLKQNQSSSSNNTLLQQPYLNFN